MTTMIGSGPPLKIRRAIVRAGRRCLSVLESADLLGGPEQFSDFDETVTMARAHGETVTEFATRVVGRLAVAERRGTPFDAALLSVGADEGDPAMAARKVIARAVATQGGSVAELVVLAPSSCSGTLRQRLFELADELTRATLLTVRIRFRLTPELPRASA